MHDDWRPASCHAWPPAARLLILTTFQHDDYVFGALRAGASGFFASAHDPKN